MDLTIWCLIFGVLTCLGSTASGRAFLLPTPENVTVDCDNFDTIVYWNYSDLLVEPLFHLELEIEVSPRIEKVPFKTRELHANITERLKSTNYAVYTIRIQAKNGTHSSNFSSPVTFTFDNLQTANILCKLDFPPVTLEYGYGALTLRFQNPMRLYENTPALKYLKNNSHPTLDTIDLKYDVVDQSNNTTTFTCPYVKSVCKETLHISDKKDRYCVSVSGEIRKANVGTAKFCYSGLMQRGQPQPSHIIAIIIGMVLISAIIVLATAVWCKKRAKTHPIIRPQVPEFSIPTPATFTHPSESFSTVYLRSAPSTTSEKPLLSDHSASSSRSSADCSRFPIVTPQERGGASQQSYNVESIERSGQGRGLMETSGGTLSSDYDSPHVHDSFADLRPRGSDADAEEEARYVEDPGYSAHQDLSDSSGGSVLSGYNSQHEICVELGPGDFVDGYAADGARSESEDVERNTKSTSRSSKMSSQDSKDSGVSGGTALSDCDSTHDISVELLPGDFVSAYTARERLA